MQKLFLNNHASRWRIYQHASAALLLFQVFACTAMHLKTPQEVEQAIQNTPVQELATGKATEIRNAINALPGISALQKVRLYTKLREKEASPTPSTPKAPPFITLPAPKPATSSAQSTPPLDIGLMTAQIRSLAEPLQQALTAEPFSADTVQKYIEELEEKIAQLGGLEKIPAAAADLRQQLPALLEQAKEMTSLAPTSPTPPSPTSQERLQEEALVITTQIKTSPLNFDQYNALLEQIRALATAQKFGASTLVQETQATLSKELETAFAKILPAIEIQNLIDSITVNDLTSDLQRDITAHIKQAHLNKELETKLLTKLTQKAKGKEKAAPAEAPGMHTPPAPPVQGPEALALRKQVSAINPKSDKQEVDAAILQTMSLAATPLPKVIQQKVPHQTEADCGYHALKNAIIIALQARGETVAPTLGDQLLTKWKTIIRARRGQLLYTLEHPQSGVKRLLTDPAQLAKQQAHYQGTDWLEWEEIDHLYELENQAGGALHNKQITITITEDPFNMWHEFITLREGAYRWAQNKNYAHMIVIGTATQKEPGTVKSVGGGHWFTLVAHKKNDARAYSAADSVNFDDQGTLIPDRRTDPRTQRIVQLFEGLTALYRP